MNVQDVCMPVMDGLEATRLIRSYEKTGNWDEARKAGVEPEPHDHDHDSPFHNQISRKRIPIVAVSTKKCLKCP